MSRSNGQLEKPSLQQPPGSPIHPLQQPSITVTPQDPAMTASHPRPTAGLSASWPTGDPNSIKRWDLPPTSTTLTSASGHLVVPSAKPSSSSSSSSSSSGSRKWSFTGRFFGDRGRRQSSSTASGSNKSNASGGSQSNRRSSSNSSNGSNNSAMLEAAFAVSASIAAALGTSPTATHGSLDSSQGRELTGLNRVAAMSPKPSTLDGRFPTKSILKKRPEDTLVQPEPGGGHVDLAAPNAARPRPQSILTIQQVHPLAMSDKGDDLEFSPNHRARLETRSPSPTHTHPSAHHMALPTPLSSSKTERAHHNQDSTSSTHCVNDTGIKNDPLQRRLSTSASIPPKVEPQLQTNSSHTQGRPIVDDQDLSEAELLNNEMMARGARNNDGLSARSGLDHRRRSINFVERTEVIPVYPKGEYNRESDKNATFQVLTPDLKSEIREELNRFKLREMAVHIESMKNTAFH